MSSHYLKKEEKIRGIFNKVFRLKTEKKRDVPIGLQQHEFDIYQKSIVAGGITTGRWKTGKSKGKNPSSGNRDRANREILWLTLVENVKRRILIVTDKEMFRGLIGQLKGANFKKRIGIMLFDNKTKSFIRSEYL